MIQKCDATPTQFVESRGTKFSFRQFGKDSDIPLISLIHFRASMENWDPKWLDDSAQEMTLIVFGNEADASANDFDAPIAQPHPDSGHGCLVQCREWVAERIRIFLDRSFDD